MARAVAWSAPAVTVAVAAPALAARGPVTYTTQLPPGSGSDVAASYEIAARNGQNALVPLPAGTQVLITPAAGKKVQLISLVGGTSVSYPDGSHLITVTPGATTIKITYYLLGAVGPGATFLATVPGLQPPTESKDTVIIPYVWPTASKG